MVVGFWIIRIVIQFNQALRVETNGLQAHGVQAADQEINQLGQFGMVFLK